MRPLLRWLALCALVLAVYGGFYRWRAAKQESQFWASGTGGSLPPQSSGPFWSERTGREGEPPPTKTVKNVSWPQATSFSLEPTVGKPVGFPITILDIRAANAPLNGLQAEIECEYESVRTRTLPQTPWRTYSANDLIELENMGGTLAPNLSLSKSATVGGKPALVLWCQPSEIWRAGQWQIAAKATIYFSDKKTNTQWSVQQPIVASFVKTKVFTPSRHTLKRGVSYIANLQRTPETMEKIRRSINYGNRYTSEGVLIPPTPVPAMSALPWFDIAPGQTLRTYSRTSVRLRAVPRQGLKWPVDGDIFYPRWKATWSDGQVEVPIQSRGEVIDVYASRVSRDKNDLLLVSAEAGNQVVAKFLVMPRPVPTPFPTPTPRPRTYNLEFYVNGYSGAQGINTPNSLQIRNELSATLYTNQSIPGGKNDPNALRIRFRAVDSQGKPYGTIIGGGTRTLDSFDYSSPRVQVGYGAPTRSGTATLWAEVLDPQGRVLAKSSTRTLEFQDVGAWCSYGDWEPANTPDEWKRNVYIYAGLGNKPSYQTISDITVEARVVLPSSSKDSWLETSTGKTNSVTYPGSGVTYTNPANRPLTFIQRAKWSPDRPFQLNVYRVEVKVKK